MNADIGMESFWANIIEILVTNFYASRVTLSIPYDLTDITNTPWGLKATYNGSIQIQQTRITLERRQSLETTQHEVSDVETDTDIEAPSSSEITPKDEPPKPKPKPSKPRPSPVDPMESIDKQLAQMLKTTYGGKVHSNLKPLDCETEPLIDNAGVQRVLGRGCIVTLSREYLDVKEMKRREEEALKAQAEELPNLDVSDKKSIRSEVLAAWEQTYFKPPEHHTVRFEEHEQPFASPWSQSPAPSPAILKESSGNPFFDNQTVESAFSPTPGELDYVSNNPTYAIGMENYQSIVHIPLIHPQTAKTISSESESSGSSNHARIVPIAILSFVSTVTPYPTHLISSLTNFAPLIATSLSLAIRHSNVVHQLTYSPEETPRFIRQEHEETSPYRGKSVQSPLEDSPLTPSSATNSNQSTPWDIQGHLFSPAVAQAETPSPFRSTLGGNEDYFSRGLSSLRPLQSFRSFSSQHRDEVKNRFDSSTDDVHPDSSQSARSGSSLETAPTEQDKSSSDKKISPMTVRRRGRRVTRAMVHSYGATTQFPSGRTPKKSRRPTNDSSSTTSDPYQMPTPSSKLLKVVVDSIPVHVFTASPGTGTITWANGRTLAYRGITAEAYIGNPHGSLHPDDSKGFLARWDRMLQLETEGIAQSVRVRRFDGQYRWFAARVVPLRDSRGGVVHWFGTCMDIHDAREAEINSARQEEVKASELKYRSLAEASPQIVFAATPSLGISYANSQWMSYSGVSYEETAKLGFLSFVHPDDRARCALPANTGDTHSQFSVEIRLQAADKSYRWHLVKCIRIESRDGGNDDVWLGTWYVPDEVR
jgi:PAS domain S-box-containing protein